MAKNNRGRITSNINRAWVEQQPKYGDIVYDPYRNADGTIEYRPRVKKPMILDWSKHGSATTSTPKQPENNREK